MSVANFEEIRKIAETFSGSHLSVIFPVFRCSNRKLGLAALMGMLISTHSPRAPFGRVGWFGAITESTGGDYNTLPLLRFKVL